MKDLKSCLPKISWHMFKFINFNLLVLVDLALVNQLELTFDLSLTLTKGLNIYSGKVRLKLQVGLS